MDDILGSALYVCSLAGCIHDASLHEHLQRSTHRLLLATGPDSRWCSRVVERYRIQSPPLIMGTEGAEHFAERATVA